jgi:hypothetical protein
MALFLPLPKAYDTMGRVEIIRIIVTVATITSPDKKDW